MNIYYCNHYFVRRVFIIFMYFFQRNKCTNPIKYLLYFYYNINLLLFYYYSVQHSVSVELIVFLSFFGKYKEYKIRRKTTLTFLSYATFHKNLRYIKFTYVQFYVSWRNSHITPFWLCEGKKRISII